MSSEAGRLPPRMSSRLRKLPLAGLILLALVALGACGESRSRVTKGTYAGESGANAPYLDVGPLIYQVQLSRQLNPYSVEDSAYLQGLTPAQRVLRPGQEWFAVFIQVFNDTARVQLAAPSPLISDTQNNVYTPVVPDQTQPLRLPRRPDRRRQPGAAARLGGRERLHPGGAAALQDRRSSRLTTGRSRSGSSTRSIACSPPRPSSTCEDALLSGLTAGPLPAPGGRRAPRWPRRRRL